MRDFATVLFDQAHSSAWSTDRDRAARMNPANPADASLALAVDALAERGLAVREHRTGELVGAALEGVDVLVVAHPADAASERVAGDLPPVYSPAEIAAITEHVRTGGGLVVLAECDHRAHGNNLDDVLSPFGLSITSTLVHESATSGRRHLGNATWVLPELAVGHNGGQGVLAGVGEVCFYRSGAVDVSAAPSAHVIASSSASAHPAQAPLAVTVEHGAGRVVVLADSDLVGDDSIADLDHRRLWTNLVTWAAVPRSAHLGEDAPQDAAAERTVDTAEWASLKAAVEELRLLQGKDGSIDRETHDETDLARAGELVASIRADVAALAPRFPHDAEYLAALDTDLARWVEEGFVVPDFLDSLVLFHPEQHRVDGTEHLVLFPMYTQNGNLDRVFEAVLLDVVWPQWLADVEAQQPNPAFLPVTFTDFTPGYDTNSAVLFPETVAVREVPTFTWGAIFCDREAARFRAVTSAAAQTLGLQLPPEGEQLVASQSLAQSTFAMWDLVHDRTHSHGDLPFDPFMIKQRMPFWMYALEELRCDLNTFRVAVQMDEQGHPYARPVQLAILFDRLFRFPITGDRVRNYDGLGGQLLFAWLHKRGVLRWTDNTLSFDWAAVPEAVVALSDAVEELYRSGIDRSRVGHWRAAYELVAGYVAPHPGSTWAKGMSDPSALPLDGPPKGLTDLVQPDEFPLNVFYEALRKKLAPVIEASRGVTGTSATGARIAA
ncbi:hypothetical protein AWH69_09755 [Janibacter melonis]|uniref:DUF4350 domain-containing protein n=1 Tax=Janibacter melonis TaxID=262209 RepID=A0A176QAL8_9MICO|nr:hypothetical protein AWH69_09755 [Janibacter melonis]